ncbi:MAG: Ig-like domain-containing protein [Thermoanaerobaculia bacterium]
MPLTPPFLTAEAKAVPPPYEGYFKNHLNPAKCGTCHGEIFAQWNGSMMSNAWRDPAWRGAFLLVSRLTSTAGDCDLPEPPDGTEKAHLNPFANSDCTSTFDLGRERQVLARPGSLLDGFCSQCHMPTNYVDNVVAEASATPGGPERGHLDPGFNPTSDAGTGIAFATLDSQMRNTTTGQAGIFCGVCHTLAGTRVTAFANYRPSGTLPRVVPGEGRRGDQLEVPDPASPNLGYAIGAASYRVSPHAIASQELLGPLAAQPQSGTDPYLSGVFGRPIERHQGAFTAAHSGTYQALHERAEACATCHDVTNFLTIKNHLGHWVGGFPIERTYTEWLSSRYADRPGNRNFDPRYKRDCQTCHMQQDFGQPGTARTLNPGGKAAAPRTARLANEAPERTPAFTHHFIGGNTFVPRLIGADVDTYGNNQPWPELSVYSFSSADEKSVYHNAYWTGTEAKGPPTQHARLAWDRLRNVLSLKLEGASRAKPGSKAPIAIEVANEGSGHNFPSGFPEGRNAWVAVRAFDLATGAELEIYDSEWRRSSRGVGYLTRENGPDPNFPNCPQQMVPAASPDPYAYQFRAVASLGDGCPTLALPYAAPLNLEVDRDGMPLDTEGKVIDPDNPSGLPNFRDLDGDGDRFDDAYLVDTRLRPMPNAGATLRLDRYSVVVPSGLRGPIAVVAAVYYQSLEAQVAQKFLGNLADTDTDALLEPCVLRGPCDGRVPVHEPAVVEGAPPVPMAVRNWVIEVEGAGADREPPAAAGYPRAGAVDVPRDVVVKAIFSEPIRDLDPSRFTLVGEDGVAVPAFVNQIGDGTWALFPHQVFLEPGKTYTARLAAGACDFRGNCTSGEQAWSFTIAPAGQEGAGTSTIPLGFPRVSSR